MQLTKQLSVATVLVVALVVPSPGALAASASTAAPAGPSASEQLQTLFGATWDAWMEDDPTWASQLGDHRHDDLWPARTLASFAARDARDAALLGKLRAIDPATLSAEDRLSRALLERQVGDWVEERRFGGHLLELNHMGGIQTVNEISDSLRFETLADYEGWLGRLKNLPGHVDETIALLREGLRRGVTQPRAIMGRLPSQVANQIVDDPAKSPFFRPFEHFVSGISDPDRARLVAEAKAAITSGVVPAYRRFDEFFTKEYLPACRDAVGVSAVPDGQAFYAFRARHHTTTDLTPQQIHDLGLAEVKRIRGEMDLIIAKVGFQGDFQAFLGLLRTDPRFFAKDADELLMRYRDASKRIDPEIVRLFGRLPRIPYGVKPIPAETAPNTTTAYYMQPAADGSRAGTYYVNLYKPEVRPLYEIEALTLHEAVPGHHLQIALAQELGELPEFRRHAEYTAFVEGWGLYAESLGDELGMYQDPYSKFGQLTYEMWRAVRLVVDTGMHSLGWERQRAIDFFKANAAKSEYDIINEIDRYIAWPGQALAYKVGELKIKELRARATTALGEKFDVRGFHDVVLGSGAVPLTVLEEHVDSWIASRKAIK